MAIELEFIDCIVPIKTIDKKYSGGWKQCLKDFEGTIGGRAWYDEHLFRTGTMNDMDMIMLSRYWKDMGFRTHYKTSKYSIKWLDVCILGGYESFPCDWLEVEGNIAYLKGKPRGEIMGSAGGIFNVNKEFRR